MVLALTQGANVSLTQTEGTHVEIGLQPTVTFDAVATSALTSNVVNTTLIKARNSLGVVIASSSDNVNLSTNDDGSVYFPKDIECATNIICPAIRATSTLETNHMECQTLQVVQGLTAGSVGALELKQGAFTLNNLLARSEGAFVAAAPLRKVVSSSGVSLGIDPQGEMTVQTARVANVVATLVRATDTTGVVLADSSGTVCLRAKSSDVEVPNALVADAVATRLLTIGGHSIGALLSERAPAFSVAPPLLRSTVNSVVTLSLDPNTTISGASFLSGKFRLRASAESRNIERVDDDGSVVTDSWQRIGVFNWVDTHGAFVCDRLRALTADHILIEDGLRVANNTTLLGSLTAGPTTLGSLATDTIITTAIFAKDNNGTGLMTPLGVPAFIAKSDKNCQCWGSLDVVGDLNVQGTISYGSIGSPYWVAGNITSSGNLFSQKGRRNMTVVSVPGDASAFDVRFEAHPDGSRYTVCLQSTEFHTLYRFQTATGFRMYARKSNDAPGYEGEENFSILVLA